MGAKRSSTGDVRPVSPERLQSPDSARAHNRTKRYKRQSQRLSLPPPHQQQQALRPVDRFMGAALSKGIWRCYSMTPPFKLSHESLRDRVNALKKELQAGLDWDSPKVLLRPCDSLLSSSGLGSIQMFMKGNCRGKKKVLHGIVSRDDCEHFCLLLLQGQSDIVQLVRDFLAAHFHCLVSPMRFTQSDLSLSIPFWITLLDRLDRISVNDSLELDLVHPDVNELTVELRHSLRKTADFLAHHLEGDVIAEEHANLLLNAVYVDYQFLSQIQFEVMQLQTVYLPPLSLDLSGRVRFLQQEFIGEAVAYLTKLAEEQLNLEVPHLEEG